MMEAGVPEIQYTFFRSGSTGFVFHHRYPRMVFEFGYYEADHTYYLKQVTSLPDDWPPEKRGEFDGKMNFNFRSRFQIQGKLPQRIKAP